MMGDDEHEALKIEVLKKIRFFPAACYSYKIHLQVLSNGGRPKRHRYEEDSEILDRKFSIT